MGTRTLNLYRQEPKPKAFKGILFGEAGAIDVFWGAVFLLPFITVNLWLFDGELGIDVNDWKEGGVRGVLFSFALGMYAWCAMYDKNRALPSIFVAEFVNRYFFGDYWMGTNSLIESLAYASFIAFAVTLPASLFEKFGIVFRSHYQCYSTTKQDDVWFKRNKSVTEFLKAAFIGGVCALSGSIVHAVGFYLTVEAPMDDLVVQFGINMALVESLGVVPVYIVFAFIWFTGIGNFAKGRIAVIPDQA